MQEADILAETYWDTVTVYRPFKDTLPSGEETETFNVSPTAHSFRR